MANDEHLRPKQEESLARMYPYEPKRVRSLRGVPNLEFFDMQCIPENAAIIQYGKRGVGKTTMWKCIASFNRYKWDEMYAFTKTAFNGVYQSFIPEHHVFSDINNEVIRMLIQENQGPNKKKVCVILDDILSSDARELRHSKELTDLFTMGRHLGICIVVNTQYPNAIPPTFRDNADYAFLFVMFSRNTLDTLYKQYGCFMDFLTFRAMVEKYTKDNGALVCCPQRNNTDPLVMFNYARACPHGPFRVSRAERMKEALKDRDALSLERPTPAVLV